MGVTVQFNALSVMCDWPFGIHVEKPIRITRVINANWTSTNAQLGCMMWLFVMRTISTTHLGKWNFCPEQKIDFCMFLHLKTFPCSPNAYLSSLTPQQLIQ